MKSKDSGMGQRHCATYAPDFKKSVILFAEKKGNREARRRYGVCESNIRRWRRLKPEIIEKAAMPKRRSRRIVNYDESDTNLLDVREILDSMPLDQRLKQAPELPQNAEPVLQSQPLSPTKLKVTRQKLQPPVVRPPTPPPVNEEVCLRWNSHHQNMQNSFPSLLLKEQYVDVTLVAEGKTLKCHRLILSSCSPYFEEVLGGISPHQHPVLFMRDIPFWILKCLLDFMYSGEVHIYQAKLQDLLNVAELLKIKGLTGTKEEQHEQKEEIKSEEKQNDDQKKPEKKEEKKRKFEDKQRDIKKEEKKEDKIKKDEKKKNTDVMFKVPTNASQPNQKKPDRIETRKTKLESDDILDPLDLLEPIYEEPAKPDRPVNKFRQFPIKKNFPRKIKKRKYSDVRDDSPPPVFHSRKGTRSRPNIKVPKFYHPGGYETSNKEPTETDGLIIERQPHTNVPSDPLLEISEIKHEPIDIEETDVIEIEDNNVTYDEDEEGESIIGDYDSPILNIAKRKSEEPTEIQQYSNLKDLELPLIMNEENAAKHDEEPEKPPEVDPLEEPEAGPEVGSLDVSGITITNVQSLQDNSVDDMLNPNNKSTEAENNVEPEEHTEEAASVDIVPDLPRIRVANNLCMRPTFNEEPEPDIEPPEINNKEDEAFMENLEMSETSQDNTELEELTNNALQEHFSEDITSKFVTDLDHLPNNSSDNDVNVAAGFGDFDNTSHPV
ncbi:uncharacterized protein LOC109603910 isoform X1 [Aethina tumida]|uniref:uncharacterized protein LOC109603910 isoform X1 n=1 Tax=Aethina tumida TaxID=116153 RepID=UPI00214881A6|nr:uncharacterized protein LOC109603910 isoform X1 [Aethina tumida]XP_019875973.2 uncharacterized protein LOC109603910 isoform X1 [Aethina tumida]XP_019875974.2 uncharacterized protein LOC109603910 isoform X1 [Aethina tumida]XP_049824687.1 uncharacterized protein LOC109603910 isoform X1 [Aethina tumida]